MVSAASGPATFSELNLDFRVLAGVRSLGWTDPTPIQRAVIPLALSGRDVIAQARTGSGKTAAFAIPILQLLIQSRARAATGSSVRAVVVCPTRDLSAQTARTLLKFTSSISSIPPPVDVSAQRAVATSTILAGGCLVGTAVALSRALKAAPAAAASVELFVIDEADAVLSMSGGDVAQLRRTLAAARQRPPQALLVSATLPAAADKLKQALLLSAPAEVRFEDEAAQISESMIPCRSTDRALCAFSLFHCGVLTATRRTVDKQIGTYRARFLARESARQVAAAAAAATASGGNVPDATTAEPAEGGGDGKSDALRRVILFVNDITSGFRLKLLLEMAKVPVGILHERLPANSRVAVVSQFNAGVFDVLVAVDPSPEDPGVKLAESGGAVDGGVRALRSRSKRAAAADDEEGARVGDGGVEGSAEASGAYGVYRGVDFVGVDAVVSVDAPHGVGSYIHRIGRTGRGVSSGHSILLHDPDSPAERLLLRRVREFKIRTCGEPRPQEHPRSEDGTLHAAMERVRYRIEDATRRLTKPTLRAAEMADLDAQIVNSERLAAHFAENPNDLEALRKASAASKAKLSGLGHALSTLPSGTGGSTEAAHKARMAQLIALAAQLEPTPKLKGMKGVSLDDSSKDQKGKKDDGEKKDGEVAEPKSGSAWWEDGAEGAGGKEGDAKSRSSSSSSSSSSGSRRGRSSSPSGSSRSGRSRRSSSSGSSRSASSASSGSTSSAGADRAKKSKVEKRKESTTKSSSKDSKDSRRDTKERKPTSEKRDKGSKGSKEGRSASVESTRRSHSKERSRPAEGADDQPVDEETSAKAPAPLTREQRAIEAVAKQKTARAAKRSRDADLLGGPLNGEDDAVNVSASAPTAKRAPRTSSSTSQRRTKQSARSAAPKGGAALLEAADAF